MTQSNKPFNRRTVMKTIGGTSLALGALTGVTSAKGKGGSKGKGGAGFTFTEPAGTRFELVEDTGNSDETFQRGCGKGGKLQPYEFFHAIIDLDDNGNIVDGETDRLYPHPNHKRIGEAGNTYQINNVCETETGRDRPAYWVTFAPE